MADLPRPGAIVAGRYRVEALLGRGGMGSVWMATDGTTGRQVAIKWLDPRNSDSAEHVARLMEEARAIGRIDHPNVVAILDVGREGQTPFLVMELLRGRSLDRRLALGPLGVREALDVVVRAGRGVAEAHREGVVHRDLKPGNIFLSQTKDGRLHAPKVVDFGIAKRFDAGAMRLTAAGVALGTPRYMAPEQLGSAREALGRGDDYTMGVVLYEALAGRHPFDGASVYEIVAQIDAGAAPLGTLVKDLPPELDVVCARAMRASPEQRYPTMRAFIDDLERVRSSLRARPPRRRGLVAIAAAMLAAAALATATAIAIAALVIDRRAPEGPTAPGPRAAVAPAEPTLELELTGGCADVRLDAPLDVVQRDQGDYRMLTLTTPRGAQLTIQMIDATRGSLPVRQLGDVAVVLHGDTEPPSVWTSSDPSATGNVRAHAWRPREGTVDIELVEVTLWSAPRGSSCTLNGRVRMTP